MSGTILQPVVGKRRGGSFTSGPPPHAGAPVILSVTSNFTTFANVDRAGSGNLEWQTPSNAQTSNNTRTTLAFGTGPALPSPFDATTDYLQCTQLASTIPSGATPVGIEITVERRRNPSDTTVINDSVIYIVKGGTIQTGTNKADTSTNYPTSDGNASYGGSGDLWGQSWTESDINASGFGVAISVRIDQTANMANTALAEIDQVYATIYYTGGGGGPAPSRRGHHGNSMI